MKEEIQPKNKLSFNPKKQVKFLAKPAKISLQTADCRSKASFCRLFACRFLQSGKMQQSQIKQLLVL